MRRSRLFSIGAEKRAALRHFAPAITTLALLSNVFITTAQAGPPTSPKAFFGFSIGDDYHLTNYTETEEYFRKIASESDRLKLVDIGETEEGRTQYMLIASSPANLAKLDHYRGIAEKLARARIPEKQAEALSAEGKAVVWIDGGLHATETVGAQQLIETIWQLASRDDAETRRILDDTIILLVHANPDGHELVGNWYMREPLPERRVLDQIPRLYNKYAGHDNNRDAYLNSLKETTNMSRVLYLQWYPQIMYNHHQTAPTGTVIAIPPYRNPPNYRIHPSVLLGIDATGAAINQRYLSEQKGGAVSRGGTFYSTWWNGGQRTTPYFHNMIGLLTEITGNPTPSEIGFVPDRQIPSTDLPLPIEPQPWHFRQSIDYSLSANWAVLDYASRHRTELLMGIYKMGRDEIASGSKDTWTFSPSRLDALKERTRSSASPDQDSSMARYVVKPLPKSEWAALRVPADRDPKAYVIPADQKDFNTAIGFVNALIKSGIEVEHADADFELSGKRYPRGSYVIRADQPFRPHVLDMFEPQDHPQDFEYPGGPPIAPYDSAGWTLAFQMGIAFDRVLDNAPQHLTRVPLGQLRSPAAGRMIGNAGGCYTWSTAINDSFKIANALLREGVGISRATRKSRGIDAGDFIVPVTFHEALSRQASKVGVDATSVTCPDDDVPIKPARIALLDRFGGSIPSGWNRKILEEYGFKYNVIYPGEVDAASLKANYDVVIVPADMAIPKPGRTDEDEQSPFAAPLDPARIPDQYRSQLGKLDSTSAAALRQFIESGGLVVAEGMSAQLAYYLDGRISNHLVKTVDGKTQNLSSREYYIPGSLLAADVAGEHPVTWGMPPRMDLYYADTRFSQSPVFDLAAGSRARPILSFSTTTPLRSGWAWGQAYLKGGVSALEIPLGKGVAYIFGTDITFRSQMQGGYKLLFNTLYGFQPLQRPRAVAPTERSTRPPLQ